MNRVFWHLDKEFLLLVKDHLGVLGIVFALMVAAAVAFVILSKGDRDDA